MKSKILVIVINIKRAQEHEWFVKMINRDLFDVELVLINGENSVMSQFLSEQNIKTWFFRYSSKRDLPKLTAKLYLMMLKGKFKIVHTHLFEASLAGLTAAFLARVPKRIMTRHYSDYHHVWFPNAVKYDRYLNALATDVIAISENVRNILVNQENVDTRKVHLIHHGLDMSEYKTEAVSNERISELRRKYNIPIDVPVIGAISRFTELKGVQYLIPAFLRVLDSYPDAILLLANAAGDYAKEIKDMLSQIPVKNVRIIEFENDIAALYRIFDCFVHIPVNLTAEAFGQTYIESLASRVPAIFTLSGVAPEFAVNKVNCLIVPYCNSNAVYDAVISILNDRIKFEEMINTGYKTVEEQFDIKIKSAKLEALYLTQA